MSFPLANAESNDGFNLDVDDASGFQIMKFVIEEDYHHLGDNLITSFQNDSPEGTTWEKSFSLPNNIVSTSTVFVTFNAVHIDHANLIVNGIPIGIPLIGVLPGTYRNHVIALPAATFYPGENTIELESLTIPGNDNFDDFEFCQLVLYFQ